MSKVSEFVRANLAPLSAAVLLAANLTVYLLGLLDRLEMPEAGQAAFVILVTAAVLWVTEAVPLFVTSIVILLMSLVWLGPMLERAGAEGISNGTWTAPFFSDVILLFLGGFVLAAGLHKYQLDEQMARLMVRKSKGALPWLIAAILSVTAFLSMWLSNTATAAMMLALTLPIVRKLPAGSRPRRALILAVPFAANVGGLGTPIGSPPNAIAMEYMRSIGQAPTFANWILAAFPIVGILLVFVWALLVYGYGATGRVEGVDCEPLNLKRSAGRITVLAVAILTAAGWLTSGWHGLTSGTVALIPVILIFGLRLLTVRDLRGLSWDVLLLMGGGLCLGTVLAKSQLPDWVITQLNADGWQAYELMAVLAVAACTISSLMSNTATANLLMPMILGLTIETKSPFLLVVAFACSLAMALPISTPPNAMAFSSGELRVADVLKPGALISAVGLAFVLTIGYWWWGLIGIR